MGILSEKSVAKAEQMFKEADTDSSGFIEKDELKAVLTEMAKSEGLEAPTDDQVDRRMKALDISGDGKISFAEFLNFLATMKVMLICATVFAEVDADKSGTIDKAELKTVLVSLYAKQGLDAPTDDEVNEYMTALDKSGDGVIDFYEFCDFMIPMIVAAYKSK